MKIAKRQHLKDTETKRLSAFNENIFSPSVTTATFGGNAYRACFEFMRKGYPWSQLDGSEFTNCRVTERVTLSVDWDLVFNLTNHHTPVRVTRYLVATEDKWPTSDPPTVQPYAVWPTGMGDYFQNFGSNAERWQADNDRITVIQKKSWRFTAPPADPFGRVSTKNIKLSKFFKGTKEWESNTGNLNYATLGYLKGYQFYFLWIWNFEGGFATDSSGVSPVIGEVDTHVYWKDP